LVQRLTWRLHERFPGHLLSAEVWSKVC
jgi:hypothetical protein